MHSTMKATAIDGEVVSFRISTMFKIKIDRQAGNSELALQQLDAA